jgi:hypothetical protein
MKEVVFNDAIKIKTIITFSYYYRVFPLNNLCKKDDSSFFCCNLLPPTYHEKEAENLRAR